MMIDGYFSIKNNLNEPFNLSSPEEIQKDINKIEKSIFKIKMNGIVRLLMLLLTSYYSFQNNFWLLSFISGIWFSMLMSSVFSYFSLRNIFIRTNALKRHLEITGTYKVTGQADERNPLILTRIK